MKLLATFLIAISMFLGGVSVVSAQTTPTQTCDCWCGLEGRGAESKGTTFASQSDCRAKCETIKEVYLACSFKGDNTSPHTNLRCWSEEQCIAPNANGEVTGRVEKGKPAECLPDFVHCLPVDKPIPLSVNIGSITEVKGIGGYIGAVYQWLLGAAAVFAVIMIMVGGIRYMLAGGSSGGVTEAKKHIFGALIGLTILFGAYLILNTVNPQLLSLQLPPIPKVRGLQIAALGQSCEAYMNGGYKVQNSAEMEFIGTGHPCGAKGFVTKGPGGTELTGEEVTCTFRGCPNKGTLCRIDTETEKGTCDICTDFPGATRAAGLVSSNVSAEQSTYRKRSPPASASVCAAVGVPDGVEGSCEYVPRATVLGGAIAVGGGDRCQQVSFSCKSGTTCEDYSNGQVIYSTVSATDVDVLETTTESTFENKAFCEKDMCGYSPTGCELKEVVHLVYGPQDICTPK